MFSSFSQVFSLVLESFKVVGPEAFVSLHSSSRDASFSTVNNAINDCQFYLDVVKNLFFLGVGFFLAYL